MFFTNYAIPYRLDPQCVLHDLSSRVKGTAALEGAAGPKGCHARELRNRTGDSLKG